MSSTSPTALILGAGGQDGGYLADLLAEKGYRVCAGLGPGDTFCESRLARLGDAVECREADVTDAVGLAALVADVAPVEVYNFAAISSVAASWDRPRLVTDVNAVGALNVLEAIRERAPDARLCQASSAEIFGFADVAPQDESTPLRPRSPYAVAKAFAHQMTQTYRDGYGLFAVNVVLYPHESPERPPSFVTRKITQAAAKAKLGRLEQLPLGNLDAKRDWGFAGDFVRGMWLALRAEQPDDYVLSTGVAHSVSDFCSAAFSHVGLDWREFVVVDPELFRPVDPAALVGDASKARSALGWIPSVGFSELVARMVDTDLERLSIEKT